MTRTITAGGARFGPIERAGFRSSCVARRIELTRRAHQRGCRLVVLAMSEAGAVGRRCTGAATGVAAKRRAREDATALAICIDRRRPETCRVRGLQGVQLILRGVNTPVVNRDGVEPAHLRVHHSDLGMSAGAHQNATRALGVAEAGREGKGREEKRAWT